MTRVLVAASSPVVRAGLEALLARDGTLTVVGDGGAPAAPPLAEQVEALDPDVVLLELSPADEQLALPAERGERPAVVVLLADPLDGATVAEVLRAGALGLLPREAAPEQILAAVHAAAAGMVVLPPLAAEALAAPVADASGTALGAASLGAAPRAPRPADGPELTAREVEVLRMLAEGLANKQIAARLGISDHTVKFHVAAIFQKLRATSRTEAVMLGARRGLVLL